MKVGGGLEKEEEEEEEEDVQPDVSHSRSMRHAFRCLSFSTIAGSDFFFYTMWAFYRLLWAKGDHLRETSHLKAYLLGSRYLEWMPNFPFGTWPGFEPMRLKTIRHPGLKSFHSPTAGRIQ